MKLFLKVFAAILCLCAVAFFVLRGTDGSVQNTPSNSVNLSLFEAADSADFMIVYAVGLGEVKRKRTVDGRLYRNFVQLLRTNRMQEDLKDTFSTSCKTGVRINFYKDSTLVEEFLFADKMGRNNIPGVWTPRNLGKINKFLKDVGAVFKECESEKTVEDEKSQTVFSVPELRSAKRRARMKMANQNSSDSTNENSLPDTVSTQVNQVLKGLGEMVFPADTALGAPLSSLAESSNRVDVSFERKGCSPIVLNDEQRKEFMELISRPQFETFAGQCLCGYHAKIMLYKDSSEIMELLAVGNGFSYLEKHQREGCFEQGGAWKSANPEKMDAFFARIEESMGACKEK